MRIGAFMARRRVARLQAEPDVGDIAIQQKRSLQRQPEV